MYKKSLYLSFMLLMILLSSCRGGRIGLDDSNNNGEDGEDEEEREDFFPSLSEIGGFIYLSHVRSDHSDSIETIAGFFTRGAGLYKSDFPELEECGVARRDELITSTDFLSAGEEITLWGPLVGIPYAKYDSYYQVYQSLFYGTHFIDGAEYDLQILGSEDVSPINLVKILETPQEFELLNLESGFTHSDDSFSIEWEGDGSDFVMIWLKGESSLLHNYGDRVLCITEDNGTFIIPEDIFRTFEAGEIEIIVEKVIFRTGSLSDGAGFLSYGRKGIRLKGTLL